MMGRVYEGKGVGRAVAEVEVSGGCGVEVRWRDIMFWDMGRGREGKGSSLESWKAGRGLFRGGTRDGSMFREIEQDKQPKRTTKWRRKSPLECLGNGGMKTWMERRREKIFRSQCSRAQRDTQTDHRTRKEGRRHPAGDGTELDTMKGGNECWYWNGRCVQELSWSSEAQGEWEYRSWRWRWDEGGGSGERNWLRMLSSLGTTFIFVSPAPRLHFKHPPPTSIQDTLLCDRLKFEPMWAFESWILNFSPNRSPSCTPTTIDGLASVLFAVCIAGGSAPSIPREEDPSSKGGCFKATADPVTHCRLFTSSPAYARLSAPPHLGLPVGHTSSRNLTLRLRKTGSRNIAQTDTKTLKNRLKRRTILRKTPKSSPSPRRRLPRDLPPFAVDRDLHPPLAAYAEAEAGSFYPTNTATFDDICLVVWAVCRGGRNTTTDRGAIACKVDDDRVVHQRQRTLESLQHAQLRTSRLALPLSSQSLHHTPSQTLYHPRKSLANSSQTPQARSASPLPLPGPGGSGTTSRGSHQARLAGESLLMGLLKEDEEGLEGWTGAHLDGWKAGEGFEKLGQRSGTELNGAGGEGCFIVGKHDVAICAIDFPLLETFCWSVDGGGSTEVVRLEASSRKAGTSTGRRRVCGLCWGSFKWGGRGGVLVRKVDVEADVEAGALRMYGIRCSPRSGQRAKGMVEGSGWREMRGSRGCNSTIRIEKPASPEPLSVENLGNSTLSVGTWSKKDVIIVGIEYMMLLFYERRPPSYPLGPTTSSFLPVRLYSWREGQNEKKILRRDRKRRLTGSGCQYEGTGQMEPPGREPNRTVSVSDLSEFEK
ncbi:hypothetical protein FA13DRAFT_1708355 [Coprinellus micaceus]|uniref:Uncharacterized protein n=1 Tax=Coprinellus micaceus TaxID=71717 RepID=A0A4Y7THE1_COPMI|nr:hypothetical protein FA13DRAFT_1708355 [Coprinellus micaceus]